MVKDLNAYMESENMFRMEGRRGVINLCKIASALGYRDTQRMGDLGDDVCTGDLIELLEDNGGLIEAMLVWIGNQQCLTELLPTTDDKD